MTVYGWFMTYVLVLVVVGFGMAAVDAIAARRGQGR